MRFIHTADWHLGRLFYGQHLTDDQAYVLEQLIGIIGDFRPDAVIVAGDLYDRAVPPVEAVELLDETLSRIVVDMKIPLVAIAGNHDSPQRIEFASRLLRAQGLHLCGSPAAQPACAVFEDTHGPVRVYSVPFAEPARVRELLNDDSICDQQTAVAALAERGRAAHAAEGGRSILVAHAFVAGGEESESERPLSIGGASTVDAAALHGFDYVALGHLHRPQQIGGAPIYYSGSIMKYSFSECAHEKSVSLVEVDARGQCRIERAPLSPKYDLRVIEGRFSELLNHPVGNRGDYLLANLLDEGPVLDAMGRLREIYPRLVSIERPGLETEGAMGARHSDHTRMTDEDLFAAFYRDVTEQELTEPELRAFAEIADAARRAEREG